MAVINVVEIANDRIEAILSRYVDIEYNSKERIRCRCPIHKGTDLNFSYDKRIKKWACFSQCGKSGDIIDLIREVEGLDFKEAINFIKDLCNVLPKKIVKLEEQEENKEINLDLLGLVFRKTTRISDNTAKLLRTGICANRRHKLYGRYVFPVFINDKPIGAIGRCFGKCPDDAPECVREKWTGGERYSKYINWGGTKSGGFKKGNLLYNQNNLLNVESKVIFVCEGPFDVAKLIDSNCVSVVGILGSFLTKTQVDLLDCYDYIIYCLDQDTRPDKMEKFCSHFTSGKTLQLPLLGYKDIGEMPPEKIKAAIRFMLR